MFTLETLRAERREEILRLDERRGAHCPPKEEKVIRLRLGICCEREHKPEEIGQEFDVTRAHPPD
jgi:DNA-directed RNA polymerase sigma subunit (sigma70/sigma32)